jgi:histidine triad (HIT) family protein
MDEQFDPQCIFCRIINKEAPSEMLYQDAQVSAFRDIHPVAPTHILIVPNKHVPSNREISEQDEQWIGHLFTTARQLAIQEGIHDSGFRLIINTGKDGGQVIYHFHLHLIGGRPMRYPMG